MSYRVNHQEIVKQLLDNKVVDFEAVGRAVAQHGPGLSMSDEPWESFCWTMRYFFRVFRHRGGPGEVEDLGGLRGAARELQG